MASAPGAGSSPDLGLLWPRPAGTRRLERHALVSAAALLAALLALLALGLAERPQIRPAPATLAPSDGGLQSLPAAALGPISKLIGARDAGFAVRGLRARNPAQRFDMHFTGGGVALTAGRARLRIALASYGYAGAMRRLSPGAPRARRNEVSYTDGPLVESYSNGPLGLEQGSRSPHAPPAQAARSRF